MFRKQRLVSNISPLDMRRVQQLLRSFVLLWEQPLWSGILSLLIYIAIAGMRGSILGTSDTGYYNYLADAFVHGQLHLRIIPTVTHDLSVYHGNYYLYWSPFPAILLMPFVEIFGVYFSDISFTLVAGAINVALVSLLLRYACVRWVIKLSSMQRGLLVLCFALGTVHITLAPFGRVWSTGQLIGFMCVALCYLAVLRLHGIWAFVWASVFLALALLTRNHLIFAGLWPACYLLYRHRSIAWQRLTVNVLIGTLPIVVAICILGLYNWLRFQNILDNGLAYHRMSPFFASDYGKYGAFNLHYLPTNLYYQYIAYPLPISGESLLGGSIFLLTPVFTAAFVGIARMRPRWSMWALLGSIVLVAIPIVLLMGTGWIQFGPRYTLDFTVPLLLLTAVGIRRWHTGLLVLLTLVSIVHYIIGSIILASL